MPKWNQNDGDYVTWLRDQFQNCLNYCAEMHPNGIEDWSFCMLQCLDAYGLLDQHPEIRGWVERVMDRNISRFARAAACGLVCGEIAGLMVVAAPPTVEVDATLGVLCLAMCISFTLLPIKFRRP